MVLPTLISRNKTLIDFCETTFDLHCTLLAGVDSCRLWGSALSVTVHRYRFGIENTLIEESKATQEHNINRWTSLLRSIIRSARKLAARKRQRMEPAGWYGTGTYGFRLTH